MFLKRIELQGFKSFADKTIIQFDQSITGIVGPNGCGKSNLNDAIRWVLGEQSVKSLRSGSAMSDIIFAGSASRKPVNTAKVTLVFDNSQHVFDSPFEEIEITRQIHRNKDTSYSINNTPCRLKDISDLVMDTGLGRDSLSIITQGNISSFADARPEDRRSLFEEAAGVAKYRKRKKTSLAKLENTQANLDRLQDLLDELESQLAPLKRQAEKARSYLQYKEELSAVEITVLTEEIQQYDARIKDLETGMTAARAAIEQNGTRLEEKEAQGSQLRQRSMELDAAILRLQNDYAQAMRQRVSLERRKAELDQKRAQSLDNEESRTETLQTLCAEARKEYEDRLERLNQLQQEYKQQQETLRQLQQQFTTQNQALGQTNNELIRTTSRIQSLTAMLHDPNTYLPGVKSILAARHSLQGIEGTVGELLKPKQGVAKAINSALGGAINNILTTDEQSARNAIRFLKNNRSGRATFLPLSVCRPRYPKDSQDAIATQSPGAIGWASDLVSCAPQYKNAKDRLLGATFVCDDLEHANETARRLQYSLKIVTLDGDIVHSGGSMTGGSWKQSHSILTMQEEKEALEKKAETLKARLAQLKQQLDPQKAELDRQQDHLVVVQVEQGKLENIAAIKKEKYEGLRSRLAASGQKEDADAARDSLVDELSQMHQRIDQLETRMREAQQTRKKIGQEMEQTDNDIRQQRQQRAAYLEQVHQAEVQLASLRTRMETCLNRLNGDYGMTYEYACTLKKDIDLDNARETVRDLREKIRKLGNVNLDAPADYEERSTRYNQLNAQKEDLLQASAQIREAISEMDETMASQFEAMFHKINGELDGVFKAMFGGGTARLILTEPDNLLESGVDIDVQPPGKRVKSIQTFSGGEKALIAISVLFSILKARTMPLCIFDEVEAALDQANVERFARYLDRFKGESQFVVVTHRPGTMEQCDDLYGVTMRQDGVSTVLKVRLEDARKMTQEKE